MHPHLPQMKLSAGVARLAPLSAWRRARAGSAGRRHTRRRFVRPKYLGCAAPPPDRPARQRMHALRAAPWSPLDPALKQVFRADLQDGHPRIGQNLAARAAIGPAPPRRCRRRSARPRRSRAGCSPGWPASPAGSAPPPRAAGVGAQEHRPDLGIGLHRGERPVRQHQHRRARRDHAPGNAGRDCRRRPTPPARAAGRWHPGRRRDSGGPLRWAWRQIASRPPRGCSGPEDAATGRPGDPILAHSVRAQHQAQRPPAQDMQVVMRHVLVAMRARHW